MLHRLFALLLATIFSCLLFANEPNYPQDYFRSPIKGTLRLSGTFGELRSNHFHSGIDIKSTVGGSGQAIVAAAEGYVARIRTQAGGYGNSVYIKHPNGYTTVYAHLHTFTPELAAYIKQEQYARESFELDLMPVDSQFMLNKGEKIGTLGNTGSSGGPHLHFEVRDTETEEPVNPLLFGFKVTDSRAPRMHQLRVYALDEEQQTKKARSYDLAAAGKRYRIKGDTVYVGSEQAGFAIKAYDHMDGVSNWNGVYRIKMYQDDSLMYRFTAERFSFGQTRYINAHMDYEERVSRRSYFNRCFHLPGNRLKMYDSVRDAGVLKLSAKKASKIRIVTEDVKGNKSEVRFWAKQSQKPVKVKSRMYNYILPYDDESAIDNGALYLYFPKTSFYETLYLNYQSSIDESHNVYSDVHHIHNSDTPIHEFFDIAIRPTTLPKGLSEKAFVAYCTKKNRITNLGGEWKYGRLWTEARMLGNYCIMVDTIAPQIRPSNFQSNMRGKKTMSFKITDNYATGRKVKGLHYRATIDEKWALFEYDAKTDRIIHRFDTAMLKGEHELRIVVTDALGNEKVLERKFRR